MKPRQGSWLKIFISSQILLPFIVFINWIFNANYMYLCTKPIVNNPFLIGEWPWYILGIELAALLHFFIVYLPFAYLYRQVKVKEQAKGVSIWLYQIFPPLSGFLPVIWQLCFYPYFCLYIFPIELNQIQRLHGLILSLNLLGSSLLEMKWAGLFINWA